jgi:hypothetical protein
MYIYLARFATIIVAICTAYVLYYNFFKPHIFVPRGIANTNRAVQIEYYTEGNTALINILPSGVWAWYNGSDVFVYGQPMSDTCGKEYQASYKIDPNPEIPKVYYSCTTKLVDLLKQYRQGTPHYMFRTPDDPSMFGVQDVMNLLLDRGVITRG